jgi:hypothetical protein
MAERGLDQVRRVIVDEHDLRALAFEFGVEQLAQLRGDRHAAALSLGAMDAPSGGLGVARPAAPGSEGDEQFLIAEALEVLRRRPDNIIPAGREPATDGDLSRRPTERGEWVG